MGVPFHCQQRQKKFYFIYLKKQIIPEIIEIDDGKKNSAGHAPENNIVEVLFVTHWINTTVDEGMECTWLINRMVKTLEKEK